MTDADVPRSNLTVSKVLETVVSYYGEDPKGRRSTAADDTTSCRYCGPDGRHCAVALFATPEVRNSLAESEGYPVDELGCDLPDYMLDVPLIAGTSAIDFWLVVQLLHDSSEYWDTTNGGLTSAGEVKLYEIKSEYDPNLPI